MTCHWPAGGPTSTHTRTLLTPESLVLTTVSPAWLGSPEQGRLSGPRFPFVPLGHAEAALPGFGLTRQPHVLAHLVTDRPTRSPAGGQGWGVQRGFSAERDRISEQVLGPCAVTELTPRPLRCPGPPGGQHHPATSRESSGGTEGCQGASSTPH